jgi:hypothetical protein
MQEGKAKKLLVRNGIQASTGISCQSEEPGSPRREDKKTSGQDWNIQHILYTATGYPFYHSAGLVYPGEKTRIDRNIKHVHTLPQLSCLHLCQIYLITVIFILFLAFFFLIFQLLSELQVYFQCFVMHLFNIALFVICFSGADFDI